MTVRSPLPVLLRTAFALAWAATLPAAVAQASPLAPEFRVGPSVARSAVSHVDADVAADVDGSFVAAWRSGASMYVRRYGASGTPLTNAILAGTVGGDASAPSVGVTAGGSFLVTWHTPGLDGTDTSGTRIVARYYDAAAQAFDDPFVVNTVTAGDQRNPKVACNPNGGGVCAIVWERPPVGRESARAIAARRFDGSGAPEGAEFTVASGGSVQRANPDVAVSFANVVFTWQAGAELRARRYAYVGNTPSAEFAVNALTTGVQSAPSIATSPAGAFAIAWQSEEADASGTGIRVRRFDAGGVALGNEFTVNTVTVGSQVDPAIAMEASGAFVVTWQGESGTFGSDHPIRAREYDENGTPRGAEFGVDTTTASQNRPQRPAVAMDADGDYVVLWDRTPSDVVSRREIWARRFRTRSAADLAVTLVGTPSPVLTDGTLTLTAEVSNLEPYPDSPAWEYKKATGAASGLSVGFTLDEGMTYPAQADDAGWSCKETIGRLHKVVCRRDAALLPAGKASVAIDVVAPSTPTKAHDNVAVVAEQFDDATANNRDAEITPVQCPATTLSFGLASYPAVEGDHVDVEVVRAGSDCGAVGATLGYNATDDLGTPTGTLSWADGETGSRFVIVPVTDDALDENEETIYLSLKNVVGAKLAAPSAATIVIADDDATPTVAWTQASQTIPEVPGLYYFTARLSAVSGRTVTLGAKRTGTATQGEDTTEGVGTNVSIEIPAGQIEASGSIYLKGDTADEPDETIVLTMSNPQGATLGATTVHTITIQDDDDGSPPPSVAFVSTAANVAEGARYDLAISLSKPSTATVTVKVAWGGTATKADHEPLPASPFTVTFAPGQTTATVPVIAKQDVIKDPGEHLDFALGEPNNAVVGANQGHTLTIVDDD